MNNLFFNVLIIKPNNLLIKILQQHGNYRIKL